MKLQYRVRWGQKRRGGKHGSRKADSTNALDVAKQILEEVPEAEWIAIRTRYGESSLVSVLKVPGGLEFRFSDQLQKRHLRV